TAKIKNEEAEHGAGTEGDAPAEIRGQERGVEQQHRPRRADGRAHPEAAVDGEIGAAAQPRWNELLDRRVDRGILAADAGTGEEAEAGETREVPRECGERGGDEIEAEGDVEELLASELIGEMTEIKRPQHGTREIGAAGQAHLLGAQLQARALLQRRRHRS